MTTGDNGSSGGDGKDHAVINVPARARRSKDTGGSGGGGFYRDGRSCQLQSKLLSMLN